MEKDAEIQLIKAVLAGNHNAFKHLVEAHKEMVYHLSLKIVQNSADAEEVAQDTFVKAFQSLRSFRGESKFATWLYRITYFTAINYTRNNKNQGKAFCEEAKQVSVNETVWETKERNAFLKEAMLQLKPQERAIITLFYLEDFSIKEIAEITSLSIANAKVRLHRSRKNLKEILECLLPNETTSIL